VLSAVRYKPSESWRTSENVLLSTKIVLFYTVHTVIKSRMRCTAVPASIICIQVFAVPALSRLVLATPLHIGLRSQILYV